jgi:cytoskeleton protein RodZ
MSQRLKRNSSDLTESAREVLHELGFTLRDAREARREDLYDVAAHLRIKPSYLFALEQGDLGLTPGRTYALGFLRTYADYLGFNGGDVVRQVKDALDATTPAPQLHYRTPIAETTRPGGFVIGLSILLVAGIYGAWHVHFRDTPLVERVASVPGELGRIASGILELDGADRTVATSPVSAPKTSVPEAPLGRAAELDRSPAVLASVREDPPVQGGAAAGEPVPTTEDPARARGGGELDGVDLAASVLADPFDDFAPAISVVDPSSDRSDGFGDPVLVGSITGSTVPELTPGPHEPTVASARELLASLGTGTPVTAELSSAVPPPDGNRVILVANEPSWVQVRSSDRVFVKTTTLEAGERLALPDREDLALWTGNAGGLEILLDGASIGSLGARGRVVRDVSLAPDALKARQAAAR